MLEILPRELNEQGKPYSVGIFECPVCGQKVKKPLSNGKKAKCCRQPGCVEKGKFYTDRVEALENGGLVFLRDNRDGTALFQCPYCRLEFNRPKWRAKQQKSCGCRTGGPRAEWKYWFNYVSRQQGVCGCCGGDDGGDIKPKERVWAMIIRNHWHVVHSRCFPYAKEQGDEMMREEIKRLKHERLQQTQMEWLNDQIASFSSNNWACPDLG